MKKQKTIHVAEKFWGYCSSDSVIDIKSKDGRTLYYFENDGRFPIKFNLPRGTWFTDNKVSRLPRPLEYICPEIPKPELNRNVKPMQFRAGNNPHKCSIDFQGKSFVDVFVDHEINKQAIPFKAFVYCHENAHHDYGGKDKDKDGEQEYYNSELKCDLAACCAMLKRGFNPSQCLMGIELCLSEEDGARWRKDMVYQWLKLVTYK
jgi:hypothetical protein